MIMTLDPRYLWDRWDHAVEQQYMESPRYMPSDDDNPFVSVWKCDTSCSQCGELSMNCPLTGDVCGYWYFNVHPQRW